MLINNELFTQIRESKCIFTQADKFIYNIILLWRYTFKKLQKLLYPGFLFLTNVLTQILICTWAVNNSSTSTMYIFFIITRFQYKRENTEKIIHFNQLRWETRWRFRTNSPPGYQFLKTWFNWIPGNEFKRSTYY